MGKITQKRNALKCFISNRIKSATLLELVVTMVIFSVIMLLVFYIISYTHIIFDRIKEQSVRSTEAITFFSVFQNDIEVCSGIEKENNYYLFKNLYMQNIQYRFYEQYITRQAGEVIDTFKIHIAHFEDKNIQSSMHMISGFFLRMNFYGHTIPFEINKKYAPGIRINSEINKQRN